MLKAQLNWSLYVECPRCGEDIDIAEQDDDCSIATWIFSSQWAKLEGLDVVCPSCKHEFELDGIVY